MKHKDQKRRAPGALTASALNRALALRLKGLAPPCVGEETTLPAMFNLLVFCHRKMQEHIDEFCPTEDVHAVHWETVKATHKLEEAILQLNKALTMGEAGACPRCKNRVANSAEEFCPVCERRL